MGGHQKEDPNKSFHSAVRVGIKRALAMALNCKFEAYMLLFFQRLEACILKRCSIPYRLCSSQ